MMDFLLSAASLLPPPPGPYKINGVPLRRVNQAYVIATSTSVDVSKVDVSKIDDSFFARKQDRVVTGGKDGEAFFAKDPKKTVVSAERKSETARVDTAIRAIVKATPTLKQYLNAKFTLTRGQAPHLMKF
jgi:large subunit ribosomal protein L6e